MPTMSHTKSERKLWHAGKKKPHETQSQWLTRVVNRARNNKGAYTPAWMKRGILFSR